MTSDSFYQDDEKQLLNMSTNFSLRRARPSRPNQRGVSSSSTSPEALSFEKSTFTSTDTADRIQRAQLVSSTSPTLLSTDKAASRSKSDGVSRLSPIQRTAPTTPSARKVSAGYVSNVNISELPSSYTTLSLKSSINGPRRKSTGNPSTMATRAQVLQVESQPTIPRGDITLFLEVNERTRKISCSNDISLDYLKGQFKSKFSTDFEGVDMEKGSIYIRDKDSSISYELEDMEDVENRSYLKWVYPKQQDKVEPTEPKTAGSEKPDEDDTGSIKIKEEMQELRKVVLGLSEQLTNFSIDKATNSSNNSDSQATNGADKPKPVEVKPEVDASEVKTLRKEIKKLEDDLCQVREDKAKAEKKLNNQITDLKAELEKANNLIKSSSNARRSKLEEDLEYLKNTYNELGEKHTDIESSIQLMRKDTANRGVIPSESRMDMTNKELSYIEETSQELLKFIDDNRPKWKRTWESELHGIVQEQQFTKDAGKLLKELREDTAPLRELYTMLEKIVDLKTKQRNMNGGNNSAALKFIDVVPSEEADDARQGVMSEIQCIEVNSEQRLKALEQATKLREKELANKVDEFEKELGDYVGNQKLRKTGGTEELEKRLQKRSEEVFKAMLSSMSAAASPSPPPGIKESKTN